MGIYKDKKSPYWLYDFTVGGSRFRGSTETDSKKQASDIFAKLRSDAVKGIHYEQKETLTLEQAITKFELNHAQFLKSYDNSVRFHTDTLLRSLGRKTPFEKIGQQELETCIATWRTEKYKRGQNKSLRIASPATINRRVAIFRKVHKLAAESWDINVKHINFGSLRLAEPEPPNNPLTKQEAEILYTAAPQHLQRFIVISLFLGWREANVLAIKGEDFDLVNMQISTYGKSNKPGGKLTVTEITDAFYRYIIGNGLHEIKGNVIKYRYKPIKRVSTSWRNLFEETGIKYRRIHDLRHTFGTWLYQATGDIKMVQETLNHASVATTMRYAHSNKQKQRQQMNDALLPEIRQTKLVGNS